MIGKTFITLLIGLILSETIYKLWAFRDSSIEPVIRFIQTSIPEGSKVYSPETYYLALKNREVRWAWRHAMLKLGWEIEPWEQMKRVDYVIVDEDVRRFPSTAPEVLELLKGFIPIKAYKDEFYGNTDYRYRKGKAHLIEVWKATEAYQLTKSTLEWGRD